MKEFNPERDLLSHSETRLSESQEALYPLLVPKNESRAINMEDFRELYDVNKDLSFVKEAEAQFASDNIKRGVPERSLRGGKLFESMINFGIDKGGFLGPDARTIVASRYDDINAGIDSFVEFEDEGMTSHLALAIDATRNPEDLTKKFDKIRESIDKGELSSAKYFKSRNFRGELRHIIRVVVGADHPAIDSFADLIVRSIRLGKSIEISRKEQRPSSTIEQLKKEFEENNAAIEHHPLQWIILLEIKPQIEAARKRAERKQKPAVIDECDKILSIINGIIKSKKGEGQSPDDEVLLNDRVYQLIQQEIRLF